MIPGADNKPYDGLTRHVYEVSKRLVKNDFTVINVVPSVDESFGVQQIDNSYTFVRIPVTNLRLIRTLLNKIDVNLGYIPHYINYYEASRKLLRNLEKPLILHTHGFYTIAQPKMKIVHGKRIVTFHGFGQLDAIAKEQAHIKLPLLNFMLRKVYRNADHYTTFSNTMKSIATRLYGIDSNNITIVPHGVDAKFFSSKVSSEEIERIEARFKLNKPCRVLFFGNLIKGKRLDVLLEAFQILKSRKCNIMLILKTGLVRHYFEILELISKLGIKDLVRVITENVWGSDLRALYKASDMFVNYHLLSGHSTALLEAMASGVPPIIYRHSLNRDIVDPSNGVILTTLDPVALADAIEMLAKDKKLCKRLGHNAMNKMLKEYDWDKVVVPGYISVYDTLN